MDEPLPCMIALTHYGQPEDRANALATGFDFHLVKPVNPETWMQTIALHKYFALKRPPIRRLRHKLFQ